MNEPKPREKFLLDLFSKIIKDAGDNPTHFKLVRAAKSGMLEYIPSEMISDFHLDSYVVEFYRDFKKITLTLWFDTSTRGLLDDTMYKLEKLLDIN